MAIKTSARNQFQGRVRKIAKGAVNSEVTLDIGGGDEITAIITNTSVDYLDLAEGREATALIKASWVILATGGLVTSARNHFSGEVGEVKKGAVNSEVLVKLPGGRALTAVITNASVDSLGLTNGKKVEALIKASHVLIAVEVS